MSVTPFTNVIPSAMRRASIAAVVSSSWLDSLGDFTGGLAPGIASAFGCRGSLLGSLIPVLLSFGWYLSRYIIAGRIHRVGDVRFLLAGYLVSLIVIFVADQVRTQTVK